MTAVLLCHSKLSLSLEVGDVLRCFVVSDPTDNMRASRQGALPHMPIEVWLLILEQLSLRDLDGNYRTLY